MPQIISIGACDARAPLGRFILDFLHYYEMIVSAVRVSVRLFTTLRELVGKGEETLEFDLGIVTVKDVLEDLAKRYGEEFKNYLYNEEREVRERLQLLVNGKNVSLLEELKTQLKEGDQVAVVPPVGGG